MITVIGTGIQAVAHLTRQAEQALRDADCCFLLDTSPGVAEAITALGPTLIDLYTEMYAEDRPRLQGYRWAAARVLERALAGDRVVFAIHGHPLVFAWPAFLVRDAAQALGIPFQLQPGISAVDTLCADLGIDPGAHGLQLVECTDLLLRRRPLHPDMPALLWQVGNLETRLHTRRRSRPERLARLLAFLLRSYPPTHPVKAVFSSPHPLVPAHILDCTLQALPDHAGTLHAGFTLYLPPSVSRPIVDLDLLRKLDDPDHLAQITRS